MQGFTTILAVILAVGELPPGPPEHPPATWTEADIERATELFENGRSLYQEGDFEAAAQAFRAAYQLSGDPVLLYNIALACDRMEAYDLAIEYLETYRIYAPAEEREALAEQVDSYRKRKLKLQLESQAVATPMAPGGETNAAASDGTAPAKEVALPELKADSLPKQPPPNARASRVFGPAAITLTAIGGAAWATALGLGIVALQQGDAVEAECRTVSDGRRVCPDDASADLEANRRFALSADIAMGIGAAATLSLIVVLATRAHQLKRQRSARISRSPAFTIEGRPWLGGFRF